MDHANPPPNTLSIRIDVAPDVVVDVRIVEPPGLDATDRLAMRARAARELRRALAKVDVTYPAPREY